MGEVEHRPRTHGGTAVAFWAVYMFAALGALAKLISYLGS
jgi:hypothetical protein